MAVVPGSLGLVAALAVSGTTLYLVYEYNKKKALLNIERGKGSWRLEYLHDGSDIPQKQKQQQDPVVKKESGACVDIGIEEELLWHQSRWLRNAAVRRLPQLVLTPPTVPGVEQEMDESGNGSLGTEQTFKDRLVNCGVDEAQVNGVRNTGNDHRCRGQQHQQRSEQVTNVSFVVTSTGRVSQSEFQGRQENSDSNVAVFMSSSSNDSRIQEKPVTDSCSEADFSWKASLSSAASSPSSQRLHSMVGCLVLPGSRKAGGKPKKVVRFSPSVAEPSSDSKAYRSRFNKAETAQHAALQVQQRTHVSSSNAAVRSISCDRPRQTLTYSVYRYRGRSYY